MKPVSLPQEPISRHPLRSRGTNLNVLTMLTLMCIMSTISCSAEYTKEYVEKILGPVIVAEPDVFYISYLSGTMLFKLQADKVMIWKALDTPSSVTVQIMDQDVIITSFTVYPQGNPQQVPVQILFQKYLIKLVIKYKHLAYPYQLVMEPSNHYLPINIANNIISIKSPHIHKTGFRVKYEIIPLDVKTAYTQKGDLPMKLWLPAGKYNIVFQKIVWFWVHWMEYAKWIQIIEIHTNEPKPASLVADRPEVRTLAPTSTTMITAKTTSQTATRKTNPSTHTIDVNHTTMIPITTTTVVILQDNHQDVVVIKFNGGQILLYLGRHHLLIQTKLLNKTYVKVKS